LPRLWDAAGALPSRFIVLVTRISFLNNEDYTLGKRILTELSGVLNWAIIGYERLMKRGHFIQPSEALELVDQFRTLSSPLTEFLETRCTLDAEATCLLSDLYRAYREWCESEHDKFPLSRNVFARDLRAAQTGLVYKRATLKTGEKIRMIGGIRLTNSESMAAETMDDEQSRF